MVRSPQPHLQESQMGRLNTRKDSADQSLVRQVSLLSPSRWRKRLALILLLSVVYVPFRGIAQSKDQEKRGLGVGPTPTPAKASVTPANPSDKPELILQSGHTKSAN